MNKKLLKEYKEKMEELTGDNVDTEIAHGEADDLLCELLTKLGYEEVVEVFKRVNKWYA